MNDQMNSQIEQTVAGRIARREYAAKNMADVPATYREALSDTTDPAALEAAASRLRQQYQNDFAPMVQQQRQDQAAADQAAYKAHLAATHSPGVAEFAGHMILPGQAGYVDGAAHLNQAAGLKKG